jgi:hypothetical protein
MAVNKFTGRLKTGSLAGVAIGTNAGAVSCSYEQTGDPIFVQQDGESWETDLGSTNLRATMEMSGNGYLPAGFKFGVTGATTITLNQVDETDGFTVTAGSPIVLGTMKVVNVRGSHDQSNAAGWSVSLRSVGRPFFIPAPT